MSDSAPRILVVSPCRDEQEHVGATIASIAGQSLPPACWVIVDDGSTDDTPRILEEASREHPFIKVVHKTSKARRVGAGVIEAFCEGLASVELSGFDYVCKLDADLELPADYFKIMVEEMDREPRLGNFSGKVYLRLDDGRLVYERMGDENAIGAAKFYRRACFEEIGGFVAHAGWDGIDGHMCRLKGWIAKSEDREDIRIVHRRLMGSSHKNIWHGRARWGMAKWYMGSSWYYLLAVCAYRMAERPFVVGGLAILYGYFRAALTGTPRYYHPGFRRHLRAWELASLLRGKRRVADEFHARVQQSHRDGSTDVQPLRDAS